MSIPTIAAKTIISNYSEGGWFGSNYNMNIYKGCCHGCIYCDSRSECYRVENFDSVRVKENALAVIEHDLKSKRKTGMVITGCMSDAYNPFEKQLELTRSAIKLIDKYGFGIAVDTKSDLVLRDIDLFKSVSTHSPVSVSITITTAEDELCRKIEQHVCITSKRFEAIKRLSSEGIPCGLLLMPTLPFINDTDENILSIVRKSHENSAKWIYCGRGFGVTLRQNQRDYFYMKLNEFFPGIKQKYIQEFGYNTYDCASPNNERLWKLFTDECKRFGILYDMDEISKLVQHGYDYKQTSLI
ncbi:MAG: Elongator protein 3/MiaB/NifB [Clostridia bacterium]|nr:Elongator protein 3/MiaB/NifB [Clostridia bacterium]